MTHKTLSIVCILSLLPLLGCESNLEDNQSRFSYAVGLQVGRSLKGQRMDDYVDVDLLAEGIRDAMQDKGRLTPEEIQQAMIDAQNRETPEKTEYKQKNQTYLQTNQKKDGVETTKSGLQYKILKKGTGKKPSAQDRVQVHYKGELIDGTEFDSSYKRGQPAQFQVGGVIQGWQEALKMMPVGSKWQLVIPSDLAYGPRGNPAIPGNSTLVFEVELLKILP